MSVYVQMPSCPCKVPTAINKVISQYANVTGSLKFTVNCVKPRSQCNVKPCVPFRNVVAEYCERNLRITARTCGAYGGLRKDRAMFYPYVAHVADDQSKCNKFSPRGGVHNSSDLRYIPSMDVEGGS